MVLSEGNMSLNYPVTSPGIDPGDRPTSSAAPYPLRHPRPIYLYLAPFTCPLLIEVDSGDTELLIIP
jgi:hypothetical protein